MTSYVANDLSILSGRTRRLAEENLGGERLLFTLLGEFGQALVALETRLIIVKCGFFAGALSGGRVMSFAYADITGIEVYPRLSYVVIEVRTPSYRPSWDEEPIQAKNCLPITKQKLQEFQPYIERLRRMVRDARSGAPSSQMEHGDLASQLSKLATLHESGMLSEEEYKQAKARLLGTGGG